MLLNNRYRIVGELGSGGFSKTYLAEDGHLPSKRYCVIKQLKPASQENPQLQQIICDRFKQEAAILEALGRNNNNIPELFAYFAERNEYYLVQEYIEGSTISERLAESGCFSEDETRNFLEQFLPVLEFVHSKWIIHRDIKPSNIIIRSTDNAPILIDFGAVKEAVTLVIGSDKSPTTSIAIGTPGYMPLEQAAGKPVFSSDLYSLGLTVAFMLTGKRPELLCDRATGVIQWRVNAPEVSVSFGEFIDGALEAHYSDRYKTAHEMLEALHGLHGIWNPAVMAKPSGGDSSAQHRAAPKIALFLENKVNNVHPTKNVIPRSPMPFLGYGLVYVLGSAVGIGVYFGALKSYDAPNLSDGVRSGFILANLVVSSGFAFKEFLQLETSSWLGLTLSLIVIFIMGLLTMSSLAATLAYLGSLL